MSESLNTIALSALEDLKAKDVVVLEVSELSDVFDTMIIASGTSNRHVKSLADNVIDDAKKQGFQAIGVEGKEEAEWVLVDYGSLVVHLMLPAARDFYELEKLWSGDFPRESASMED